MPFFHVAGAAIYFAHVPRCGGTSVEDAIAACGVSLSFLDRKHLDGRREPWTRTSPQHALAADIERLFSADYFDHAFAVVRDPAARFVSAFNFNRENGLIEAETPVADFVARLEDSGDGLAGSFDNHFAPASAFVPQGAVVFHLEDGLAGLEAWLAAHGDETFAPTIGVKNAKSRSLKAYGRRAQRMIGLAPEVKPIALADLDDAMRARLKRVYAADYHRFHMSRDHATGRG